MDLIFPHHENEEAQCCAKFGVRDWVKHWIHTGEYMSKLCWIKEKHFLLIFMAFVLLTGHLNMKGDTKMSKSLGNTVTVQDFLKEHSAQTLRMFCILSKYRNGKYYY